MPKFKIGDKVQISGNLDDANDPGVINAERDGKFEVIWSGNEGFTYGQGQFWWEPHELRHIGETIGHEPLPALASPRADSDERTAGRSAEAMLLALDRFDLKVLSRDVEPRNDDTWAVIDTKTADPETNWPGKLVSEHATHAEARVALMRAALASATPAQPAGAVPDSLRALSEAVREYGKAEWSAGYATGSYGEGPNPDVTDRLSNVLNSLSLLLASHPAGQSAGSGAETGRANLFEMLWRDAEDEAQRLESGMKPSRDQIAEAFHEHRRERQTNLPPWSEVNQNSGAAQYAHTFVDRLLSIRPDEPAPDSTRTGQVGLREALARSLTKSVAGGSPDRYRIEIACPDLATMQVLRDGLVSLRDNPAAITAPHDDGFTADELREIRAAIMELGAGAIRTQKITDHQAAEDLQRHCIGRIERALASRLAARPAAPAAPGVEHPDDSTIGTAVQAIEWSIGIEDPYDRLDFLKAWSEGNLREWPDFATFVHGNTPTPPASSGQEP